MSIETQIDLVSKRIGRLAVRLKELGFEFDEPGRVFPGPESETETSIARIESEIGKLPLALKLFWRKIGSVDFCGSHPDWKINPGFPDFEGDNPPDPLLILPISAAINEMKEFLGDKAGRLRCGLPYVVPIAPDALHKAGISGGMWYNVSVPSVADDPPLNAERYDATFLNYVELAVSWAGFPGLKYCPNHNWPISKIIS